MSSMSKAEQRQVWGCGDTFTVRQEREHLKEKQFLFTGVLKGDGRKKKPTLLIITTNNNSTLGAISRTLGACAASSYLYVDPHTLSHWCCWPETLHIWALLDCNGDAGQPSSWAWALVSPPQNRDRNPCFVLLLCLWALKAPINVQDFMQGDPDAALIKII